MSNVSSTETVTSISSVISADSTKQLILDSETITTPAELIQIALNEHAVANEELQEEKEHEEALKADLEVPELPQTEEWPKAQIIKLFLIGLALTFTTNFPSAFTHTSVNTAYPEVNKYLNSSYTQRGQHLESQDYVFLRSILGSSWYAGQVLGAQFSPFVTDHWGRKPAYLIATAVMTFACALQSVATMFPYPELLIFGRVLASLFSPMSDAAAILYLQEVAPIHLRGSLSSLFTTTYSIMGLLGMTLGTKNALGYSLEILLFVPVIPGILSLLLLFYLPETPKFLKIVRHSDKQALKSIHFYQGKRSDNQKTLESYAFEGNETDGSVLDLFKNKYLQRALVLTVFCTIPTLAFYPVLQSSTYLVKKLKFEGSVAENVSVLMMAFLIISCVGAAKCLNKFSRRRLLIVCSCGATLSLTMFAISAQFVDVQPQLKYLALLGLFSYLVFYGFGLGPISFFLGTELVPLQYRSCMFSVSFSINNIVIVLTSMAVQPAYEAFGSVCFIVLFVVPNLFAIAYLNTNLPETKNKETHEIVAALERRTKFFSKRKFFKRNIGVANPSFVKGKGDVFIVEPFRTHLV